MVHYLIDAESVQDGVKLIFFNPSTRDWEEVLDRGYRPYFFVPHPINQKDLEAVEELGAKTRVEEKIDLFTGQTGEVTRVEVEDYAGLKSASKRFGKTWEEEVPLTLSYVYDRGLIFGAQHLIEGEKIRPILDPPTGVKRKFEDVFSEVKKVDLAKYRLLEKWLILCSQPIPEIPPKRLRMSGKVDPERYYLSFILSRVANLPVPQAFINRQVSTWLRSILHNHLRINNILIPTSKELKRGETKRSVKGALTFPPEPGVHFNTVVTDFESLYPSLIDAYNLSHETIDCLHKECQDNKVPGLENHICTRRRGVYSILIGSLKDLRIHWFKPLTRDRTLPIEERRLAQATSQFLKLILVSSYGVTIRMRGLARPSLAESITAYGRYSLKTTWNIAKEGNLHPIYGDTDSLFLDDPSEEQVEWLIRTVKDHLNLDLAVDERYSVCVLPRAMKAYFGIRRDGTPDIKGLTAIKSNSPLFIQEAFRGCVKEMTHVENQDDFEKAKTHIKKIVNNAINDLKTGSVPLKNLEYHVELHEDPRKKMEDTALHQPYQCAIQLIDSGQPVKRGDIVNFVKVNPFLYRERTFTVKPTEHIESIREVNVKDYVRNLRTAINQTFKPMDLQNIEKAEKKVTLSDFI